MPVSIARELRKAGSGVCGDFRNRTGILWAQAQRPLLRPGRFPFMTIEASAKQIALHLTSAGFPSIPVRRRRTHQLALGSLSDPLEQEADRTARQVMSMTPSSATDARGAGSLPGQIGRLGRNRWPPSCRRFCCHRSSCRRFPAFSRPSTRPRDPRLDGAAFWLRF